MPDPKSLYIKTIFLFIYVSGFAHLTSSQNSINSWPQFRGPNSNQIAVAKDLPHEWNVGNNLAWFYNVPGRGWSSPIIWGDKVFFTNAVLEDPSILPQAREGERPENPVDAVYSFEVFCLDINTGKEIWKKVAYHGLPRYKTNQDNNYAPETMVTDGLHVYAYFGMTGLYCYDMNGNLVWERDLGNYPMQSDWGTATSPLLHNGILYMQIDNEENSFLAALNAKTGNEKWRISRDEKSNWGTPMIWKNSLRTELVTPGVTVRSYNPENGELFWEFNTGGGRSSASPTADGDLIFFGNENRGSSGGVLFGIKAGATGDISLIENESSNKYVAWSLKNAGIAMPSPLVYEGLVYIAERNRGRVTCVDAKTGEIIYREQLPEARIFWASPWAYDGKIYFLEEEGTTYVIQAGKDFKVLGENKLDDTFFSTTAIANNTYIFRGQKGIYCIK
ncbi:MAG: PQQ-binding-like beta-propeller repeat protein [Prolixibacteraceae bacterium]|nr:PQQ-binding-like beta-propeller repeat protein [Prolixibacteraceae bacterium]